MPLEELTRELVEAIARQHPTLQRLTLARNALRELPFLELLPPLRRLDLSANRLRVLPPETATWGRALEFLDLSDNALESLQQLGGCVTLHTLHAGGNRIALYSELKYLQPLLQLRELTLARNPIAQAPQYRREVVAMLPQLVTLDGRAVTPAERLVASLQQKPQLSIATNVQEAAIEEVGGSDGGDGSEVGETGIPELDLSDASSVAWSTRTIGNATSPLSAVSPASSSPASIVSSPYRRRTLLTPASLRLSVSEQPVREAAAYASVATQAELRREADDGRRHSRGDVTDTKVVNESEGLLRNRVQALENILSLQDKMIEDGLAETVRQQQQSVTQDPEKAARVYTKLLAAWRQKVVSLMVQIKSLELQKPVGSGGSSGDVQAATEAASAIAAELELWKERYNDALAQRDLERVRAEQTQRQSERAEQKVVKVVRTLATERERVRCVAEEVALFSAKEGVMTTQLDTLTHATRRLHAYETRLRLLSERVHHASQLVAHREARLRNSEAAIEAERRMWNHKMTAVVSIAKDAEPSDSRVTASAAAAAKGKPAFLLRPATEPTLRLLFHRLDPYGTGLVATSTLLESLRSDGGVRDALGSGGRGDSKVAKIVEHIESGLRERSPFGGLSGTITWGELLLLFMPAVASVAGDGADEEAERGSLCTEEGEIPPRFDGGNHEDKPTRTVICKREKQALHSLTRQELISEVVALRCEREQLQRRVLDDARRLQSRAQAIQKQWATKANESADAIDDLHKRLRKQTQQSSELERKLQEAERVAGEAQYQLQSLRRQLSEQASQFASQKSELEAQCAAGVEREQQVWQREVEDMAFQQTQLQAENAKLELSVRQLEREIAKQREQRELNESAKVQHLEDKLRKRDDELARLRRERNTILNALREQEHKLAERTAQQAATRSDHVHSATQTEPLSTTTQSVAVQTSAPTSSQPSRPSYQRMSLDEISPRATEPETSRASTKPAPSSTVTPQDLHKRLQQLESLTESLLAD